MCHRQDFSFIVKIFLVFKIKKIFLIVRGKGVSYELNFGNYYYKMNTLHDDNPLTEFFAPNRGCGR